RAEVDVARVVRKDRQVADRGVRADRAVLGAEAAEDHVLASDRCRVTGPVFRSAPGGIATTAVPVLHAREVYVRVAATVDAVVTGIDGQAEAGVDPRELRVSHGLATAEDKLRRVARRVRIQRRQVARRALQVQ